MTQENLLLAAAEADATVVGVEGVDGSSGFYEWNALVVRIDADTTLFAARTTKVCWRLLFEGAFYRSKSVVACRNATPLPLLPPNQETVPADAVDRLTRVLISGDPSENLRSSIESAFPELNSRNIKIIVVDGAFGVALDDGERCVIGRAGSIIEVRELDTDSIRSGSCSPGGAVILLEAPIPDR